MINGVKLLHICVLFFLFSNLYYFCEILSNSQIDYVSRGGHKPNGSETQKNKEVKEETE